MKKKINFRSIIIIILILNLGLLAASYRALNEINNNLYIQQQKVSKISSQELTGLYQNQREIYPVLEEKMNKPAEAISLNLGEYKLTAYCPCKKCCGKWSYEVTGVKKKTASGTYPEPNKTVAADTSILPFGSKIMINNQEYVVEDTGKKVKGKHIDVYFEDHDEALNFGRQFTDIFMILE